MADPTSLLQRKNERLRKSLEALGLDPGMTYAGVSATDHAVIMEGAVIEELAEYFADEFTDGFRWVQQRRALRARQAAEAAAVEREKAAAEAQQARDVAAQQEREA